MFRANTPQSVHSHLNNPLPTFPTSLHSKTLTCKSNISVYFQKPKSSKRKINSFTTTNFNSKNLNSKYPKDQNLINKSAPKKYNMESVFSNLSLLQKSGHFNRDEKFHFDGVKLKEKSKDKIEENSEFFKVIKNCNFIALNNFRKKHKENKGFESVKEKESRKSIIEMKRNFFFFQKQSIVKSHKQEQFLLNQSKDIGGIYQKFFERKNMNKLCNLKEFANLLKKKEKIPLEMEENLLEQLNQKRKDWKISLPSLEID